ncbi:MAG TPA: tetratricopeptide repeat protein, partial [Thermoguttaceae bacterium]|nr:tetratricopeptide repeat protein [Thermoguttaceae bacterium]
MTREKDANLPPGPKMRPFDFQFSLKRLLVATAICAVFLSVVFSGLLTDDVQQGLRSHSPFVLIAIVLLVLFADLGAMHYRNGITAFEVGNYRRAITLFTRAIQADPTNPIRYCCRAAAHGSRRDYDAAISDYGNAIRQDSRCAHAWIGRAIIKMHQRCYSEAVDDATIGLCIKPDDRDGLFARGYCCF